MPEWFKEYLNNLSKEQKLELVENYIYILDNEEIIDDILNIIDKKNS